VAQDLQDLRRWVEDYVGAWDSNDPEDIKALFTEEAAYYTEPRAEPWVGHDRIVQEWLNRKDEPGDYTFRFEPLAIDGGLGFVRGWTSYADDPPKEYDNLWVIRLAGDGRASEFTEWWVRVRGTPASAG
jgi:hypothetical protein